MKLLTSVCIATLALVGIVIGADEDAAKADAAREEMKKLEGAWTPVWVETDGKKAAAKDVKGFEQPMIFKHGKTTLTDDKGKNYQVLIRLYPTEKSKRMDRVFTEGILKGAISPCIYELEGDKLRICINNGPGPVPPKKFISQGTFVIFTLKREHAGQNKVK